MSYPDREVVENTAQAHTESYIRVHLNAAYRLFLTMAEKYQHTQRSERAQSPLLTKAKAEYLRWLEFARNSRSAHLRLD